MRIYPKLSQGFKTVFIGVLNVIISFATVTTYTSHGLQMAKFESIKKWIFLVKSTPYSKA